MEILEKNTNTYTPTSVCSKKINFELEEGIVKNVNFEGGCNGNLKGISALVEGLSAESVISRLKGITCGNRPTSCPDQLSKALEDAINN
ncbi:MAG: TIGR03905 family TSCPD domain-containing protein [bacterium]